MREVTEIKVIIVLELTPDGKKYVESSDEYSTYIESEIKYLNMEERCQLILVDTGYIKSYALIDALEIAFVALNNEKLQVIQQIVNNNYGKCVMEIVVFSKDVFPEMYISEDYVKKLSALHMNIDIDLY